MAVAVVVEFDEGTLDQYDRVIELMGFRAFGPGAPGAMFHWVTKTDTGIRVTDVWESAEVFQRFAEEQIKPSTQEAGITGEPRITMFEVHNYLTEA